jgi:hypothetical protein
MKTSEQNTSISRLLETSKHRQRVGRRSFMIAAAASIAQPITSVADIDSAANIIWMALNKPCRVLPGLQSQRLPDWLCRAYCHRDKHFCLEQLTTQ